jgi:hypothetical protein
MEKKNVPGGKKFRMVNFKEKSEAATKDNEKWQTHCGCGKKHTAY